MHVSLILGNICYSYIWCAFLDWPAYLFAVLCFASPLYGLVREDNLLIRWAFDEGNGTIVADNVSNSTPLFLDPAARWGSGNALSDIPSISVTPKPTAYAESVKYFMWLIHLVYSYGLKRMAYPMTGLKFLVNASNYRFLISPRSIQVGKRLSHLTAWRGNPVNSPALDQLNPLNSWNCWSRPMMANNSLPLNGKLVGALSLFQTPENDSGNLGIGLPWRQQLIQGMDRWDTLLLPLTPDDVDLAFGDGFEIWDPVPFLNRTPQRVKKTPLS